MSPLIQVCTNMHVLEKFIAYPNTLGEWDHGQGVCVCVCKMEKWNAEINTDSVVYMKWTSWLTLVRKLTLSGHKLSY